MFHNRTNQFLYIYIYIVCLCVSVCVRVSVLPDGGRKERHVWEGHGASGGMTGAWLTRSN